MLKTYKGQCSDSSMVDEYVQGFRKDICCKLSSDSSMVDEYEPVDCALPPPELGSDSSMVDEYPFLNPPQIS